MTAVKTDDSAFLAALLAAPPEQSLPVLDRSLYAALRSAVELGKWEDGTALAPTEVERALQLLILYEHRHLPTAERLFSDLPTGCGRAAGAAPAAQAVRHVDPGEH